MDKVGTRDPHRAIPIFILGNLELEPIKNEVSLFVAECVIHRSEHCALKS